MEGIIKALLSSDLPYIVVILIGVILFEGWNRKRENDRYFEILTEFKTEAVNIMKELEKTVRKHAENQEKAINEMRQSSTAMRDTIMRLEGMLLRNGKYKG